MVHGYGKRLIVCANEEPLNPSIRDLSVNLLGRNFLNNYMIDVDDFATRHLMLTKREHSGYTNYNVKSQSTPTQVACAMACTRFSVKEGRCNR